MRRWLIALLAVATSVLSVSGVVTSVADIGLDTSFGDGGSTTVALGAGYAYAMSAVLDSDGRPVLVGGVSNGVEEDTVLMRFTTEGTLDTDFGGTGVVTTSAGTWDAGNVVIALPNSKLLVASYSDDDIALSQFRTDGTLDPTFGAGGQVVTSVGPGSDGVSDAVLLADGGILVAGTSSNGANNDFALLRYTSSGGLDAGFGIGGMVTTSVGALDDVANGVAVAPDGTIFVAGYAYRSGSAIDLAVVAYTSTGALATSFGVGGKVTTSVGPASNFGHAVAVQGDGKVLAVGRSTVDGVDRATLLRYTTAGVLDATFGTGGVVSWTFGGGNSGAADLAVLADGRILVAGGPNGDVGIARFLPDGTLDTTFGVGGLRMVDLGASDYAVGVAPQGDGKVLVGAGSGDDFVVLRYLQDGRIPPDPVPVALPPELPTLVNTPAVTETLPPTTTPPTTPPPSTTVAPEPSGDDVAGTPGLAPGALEVVENGEPAAVEVSVRSGAELVISGADYGITLAGVCEATCSVAFDGKGDPVLQLEQGGGVRMVGEGYEPGTAVTAWLYSTPTYLGEVTVAADGTFDLDTSLGEVEAGAHTLQILGTGPGGVVRTVTLGVTVTGAPTTPSAVLPATGSRLGGLVWLAVALVVLGSMTNRRRRASHLG